MGTEFIRALEHHRARTHAGPARRSRRLPRLLMSWIHHDNMLEGEMFAPQEIQQALAGADDDLDRYLHPLMDRIRRYARDDHDTVCGRSPTAGRGPSTWRT
jgi:hypothetical protein